ncbi:hypothetical protein KPH14_008016 [Odynerus spinipes]|uniref:Protein SMG7 n=1 Tax=Odynerus spinipes TaxID=1348599 RepID=A0AAD9RKC7_9HYME|nr:hypothetical protein KPH14_008016 [Odynerus spinipes]
MGLKAAVQALKKAEPLKDKVQRCKDLLNDNDAWVCQQQLQKIYQQVLILDLEYALDKKVEQELWNLGFKNYIAMLQSQAKDRKNPKRGESQALLSWCLEAASGFYLTLLQEICTAFDLDLPFRRKGYVYGCTSPWKAVEKLSTPHKSSCFYACQYCLVHLGDIARYRNESKQAELFYRHAVSLSPSSGQPYNQLALLEASRGDKLGTVFHYARSVTVKHPFPVATANLAKTLSSALNDHSYNIEGKSKLNAQEYVTVFLKLHGIIHNLGDLKIASSYVKLLTETLTALVATESFSSWMLVQMLVINLYALQHTTGITSDAAELLKTDQLSADEKLAKNCILDLISGSLAALLLPVYTIKNRIVEYFALPSIKLCLDWIRINPTVLEETAFTSRLQIWPSLCVLLNALQQSIMDFKYDQYVKVPLPEDRDLQGFLPLEKNFENLKFTNTDLEDDIATLNKLRAARLIQLGHYLTQHQINESPLIAFVTSEKIEENKFIPMSEGIGPSNELMKELEELSLNKEKPSIISASPVLSESASSKGSAEVDVTENAQERRVGILKPQGSLERNRDSVTNNTDSNIVELNSLPLTRKPRQNIAMQAIMRRAETEQKQVTFKNVSPVCIEEEADKVKTTSTTSPTKSTGNKNIPITTESIKLNTNALGTVQNRLPLMPCTTVTIQGQSIPTSNQLKTAIIQPSSQVNQISSQEQSSDALPQASCLPQYGQQSQTLGSLCYQNQSFNVQNPQFAKNFMSGHIANMPTYALQGQLTKPAQTLPQNLGVQHIMSQNRPLLQRMVQNVSQGTLLQQNVGISPTAQQNIMPNISQSVHVQQTANTGLQPNINRQQQNHNLGIQQQNIIPNNSRSNGMSTQSQINMPTSIANNISTIQTLNTYQKNLQQVTNVTNMPNNSLNPNNITNYQLNFNQSIYTQNNFNHVPQKQLSPTIYNKNTEILDFPFSNQIGPPKNQQQSTSNYPVFQNFESTDFGLWKDTQPPQPPVAWWGATRGTQMHSKDSCTTDTFQNWTNAPNSGNMSNRSLIPCTNYQQNTLHDRHFGAGSNFEDSRAYEVDQKSVQSTTTGNTYSLFSGNTWGSGSQISNSSNQDQVKARLNQQSLWSGPGPSPLERLLEQQKSLREGGT